MADMTPLSHVAPDALPRVAVGRLQGLAECPSPRSSGRTQV